MRGPAGMMVLSAILMLSAAPTAALQRTVCPAGCDSTTITGAMNVSASGDSVLVKSTYTGLGETFPIETPVSPTNNITLTGEVDGSGSPISTVSYTGPNNGDVIIIVSPGSTVSNLRIVLGNANHVRSVIAAADSNGPTGHLIGLTITNVVIDFTLGSPTFNADNGLDLIADNVTIQNSTIKGIATNSIFVDGDTYTIQNNTLNGFDGATVRGSLAIGFGADIKVGGTVCAGKPTGYTISGNLIQGFTIGIQWCTGLNNNTVSNNTIQNVAQKAIDTSGSTGTVIEGNTITWTSTGSLYAIGMTANAFQGCNGNIVRQNQITGRTALDVENAMRIQDCTNTQIISNTLKNFGSTSFPAISFAMQTALPTASIIQGNTVQNGMSYGIMYMGSDSGGTAVDRTMVLNNTVESHQNSGILFWKVKGPGNKVEGNIARSSNLGHFANGSGLSLQDLAGTLIDSNQAFDTQAGAPGGAGFFLANSQNLTGSCNTGSNNFGGLLVQLNVSPPFSNPPTPCVPTLTLQLNKTAFATGQTMVVTATLTAGPTPIDAYVVVQLANGTVLSLLQGGGFASGLVPIAKGFTPFALTIQLLSYTFNGTEPAGTYTWYAGLALPGTLSAVSAIDQKTFTFGP